MKNRLKTLLGLVIIHLMTGIRLPAGVTILGMAMIFCGTNQLVVVVGLIQFLIGSYWLYKVIYARGYDKGYLEGQMSIMPLMGDEERFLANLRYLKLPKKLVEHAIKMRKLGLSGAPDPTILKAVQDGGKDAIEGLREKIEDERKNIQ